MVVAFKPRDQYETESLKAYGVLASPLAEGLKHCNVEAEELILGGIMFAPNAMSRVMTKNLKPYHFVISQHSLIFETMLEMFNNGEKVDLTTVMDKLQVDGNLEAIGGISKLAYFVERTTFTHNIDRYAHIVIKHWERRRLLDLTSRSLEDLQYHECDVNRIKAKLFENLSTIGDEEITDDFGDPIDPQIDEIRKTQFSKFDIDAIGIPELTIPLKKLASWLNLRPEAYLTTLFSGLSAMFNPSTRLVINEAIDFTVTPNLFGALVAPSSQKKSPIIRAMITRPLRTLQNAAKETYQKDLEVFEQLSIKYEQLKASKDPADKDKLAKEFPNGRPKEPTQKVFYFTNATTEGMLSQFQADQSYSRLYLKDELAGLFKSFNQYRGGRGSDEEDLLSYYDGSGETRLRAGKPAQDIESVPLSIFGSIQPEIMADLLRDGDNNGKWSRFIFVSQPLAPSVLPSDSVKLDLNPLLEYLYGMILTMPAYTFTLSPRAYKKYAQEYNELEKKRVNPGVIPALSHVYGKAEGRIGKLAIILHSIKYIMLGQEVPSEIGSKTLENAIQLTRFYTGQIESLYRDLENTLPNNLAKVLDLADRSQEPISARDVHQSLSSQKRVGAAQIREWFQSLVSLGKGILIGSGKSVKFKSTETTHNDHNGHNEENEENVVHLPWTPPTPPTDQNVANVDNVATKDKKPAYSIGDKVKVNTAKGWKAGYIVDFDDRGLPIIESTGRDKRKITAFNWECVKPYDLGRLL